jgi:hypothetical protein
MWAVYGLPDRRARSSTSLSAAAYDRKGVIIVDVLAGLALASIDAGEDRQVRSTISKSLCL